MESHHRAYDNVCVCVCVCVFVCLLCILFEFFFCLYNIIICVIIGMQIYSQCDELKNLLDEKGIQYNHLDMTEMPNKTMT